MGWNEDGVRRIHQTQKRLLRTGLKRGRNQVEDDKTKRGIQTEGRWYLMAAGGQLRYFVNEDGRRNVMNALREKRQR